MVPCLWIAVSPVARPLRRPIADPGLRLVQSYDDEESAYIFVSQDGHQATNG